MVDHHLGAPGQREVVYMVSMASTIETISIQGERCRVKTTSDESQKDETQVLKENHWYILRNVNIAEVISSDNLRLHQRPK